MPRKPGGRYKNKVGRVFDPDTVEQHAHAHHHADWHRAEKPHREHGHEEKEKEKEGRCGQRQGHTLHAAMHLVATVKAQREAAKRRAINLMLGTTGRRVLVRIFYAWRIGIIVARKEQEDALRHSAWKRSCIWQPGDDSHVHCDAHLLLSDPNFQMPFDVVSRQVLLTAEAKKLQLGARASSVPAPNGLGYSHPALQSGATWWNSPPRLGDGAASPCGSKSSDSSLRSPELLRRPNTSPALPGARRRPPSASAAVPQVRLQRPASSGGGGAGGETLSLRQLQQQHEEMQLMLQDEEDEQRGPPVQMATEWRTGRRTVYDSRRGIKMSYSAGAFPELVGAGPKKKAW
mmetsp:Transcript_52567/g.97323  ORF Transcript_52567/g.97323 Transcript_52567/m.97323 type:complete len:346 (+) Transcript_52567:92-1129(+)